MPEIKLKRGLKASIPILDVAEPGFTTDTEELFMGGANGNIKIASQSDVDDSIANTIDILAHVDANSELVNARGTYSILGDRLANTDSQLDIANQNVAANTTSLTDMINQQESVLLSKRHYNSLMKYAEQSNYPAYAGDNYDSDNYYVLTEVGDSIITSTMPYYLNYLLKNCGLNGFFSKFDFTYNDQYGSHIQKCVVTNITQIKTDDSSNENWGFTGRSHQGSVGAKIEFETLSPYTFTDFRIFFFKGVGKGQFTYSIDGGTPITVDTSNASDDLGYVEVNGLTNKTHNIVILVTSGSCTFYGIQNFKKGQNGVIFNGISEGGTFARQWANRVSFLNKFNQISIPDQFHIALGANDSSNTTDTNNFQTNLGNIISQSGVPAMSDIVLYTHYLRGVAGNLGTNNDSINGIYVTFKNQIFTLAKQYNCSIASIDKIFPSRADGLANDLWLDETHIKGNGALLWTQNVLSKCIPTLLQYNKTPSVRRTKNSIIQKSYTIPLPSFNGEAANANLTNGGVLAPNGKIYLNPSTNFNIYSINTKDNYISSEYWDKINELGGNNLYTGGLAPNGCIYYIPKSGSKGICRYDPEKKKMKQVYAITVSSGNYQSLVITPDGILYVIPFSQNNIIVFNTNNDTLVTTIDLTPLSIIAGGQLYLGGVYYNNAIYVAPYSCDHLLKIDTVANTASKVLTGQSFSAAYKGGVLAPNGKIYFIASMATNIGIYDPVGNTIDTTTIAGLNSATRPLYGKGILAPDGKIYCSPDKADHVLVINPTDNTKDTTTFAGYDSTVSGKFSGTVLSEEGNVVLIPNNIASATVITIPNQTLNKEALLSLTYNR